MAACHSSAPTMRRGRGLAILIAMPSQPAQMDIDNYSVSSESRRHFLLKPVSKRRRASRTISMTFSWTLRSADGPVRRCAHAMQCGPLTTPQCADLSKPCKRRVQRRNRRQRAMALRTRRLQACNALVSIESVLIADNPFKPSQNSTEGEPRRDSSLKRPPGTQM